jgi:hypothetical protein
MDSPSLDPFLRDTISRDKIGTVAPKESELSTTAQPPLPKQGQVRSMLWTTLGTFVLSFSEYVGTMAASALSADRLTVVPRRVVPLSACTAIPHGGF